MTTKTALKPLTIAVLEAAFLEWNKLYAEGGCITPAEADALPPAVLARQQAEYFLPLLQKA